MKATKRFESFADYEDWTQQFDGSFEFEEFPVVIDDGWKISADMSTECKSWKTALKRFAKAFDGISEITDWIDCIRETCENGCFEDFTGWQPGWTSDKAEIREFGKNGRYSWAVEENSEGYWYIFLNISGCWAGRKRQTA